MPLTAVEPMTWTGLLDETRQRELLGGAGSSAPPADRRTEFDRDYDRALFATPVRRLQDKAQVFPLEPNDSVRTRLTHSLEVSTVAHQVASNVAHWMRDAGYLDSERAVQSVQAIAATCGLLHDIGNPPFGHSGEAAIQAWFHERAAGLHDPHTGQTFESLSSQQQNDFLRFEGNAQTIRLVSRLQVLRDWNGLNLTCGTLSTACKYIAPSHEAGGNDNDHACAKPGYFHSETPLVERLRAATGTGAARHPVTYVVEAADDIVYSIIDLEDGVKKGILDWSTLDEALREVSDDDPRIVACLQRAVRTVDDGPYAPRGRARDEALVQALRTSVMSETVSGASIAFQQQYEQIITGRYRGELIKDSEARVIVKACKTVGRRLVYAAPNILRLEVMGRGVLHDLMDLFWQAAAGFTFDWLDTTGRVKTTTFPARIYALLSPNYRAVFEESFRSGDLPPLYARLQLVTDSVAGMTDTFACTLHRQLTNRGD